MDKTTHTNTIGDKHSRLKIIFAFTMIYIVWGSTFFFIHKSLAGFEPFLLGAIRFTLAGLLLLGWCAYRGYRLFDRDTIVKAGFTGMLLLFVDNGIIIWVEQFLPSGLVAIMSASAAIWFILLDKPQWKANFGSLPIVAGLFTGFFGVIMLFGDQVAHAMDLDQRQTNLWGMLLLVVGAIAWTAGSLYSKYFGKSKTKKHSSLVNAAWQMLAAGTVFLVTAVARGEVSRFHFSDVPASAWWYISYLILFGSVIAYSSYIWLLQVRPATQVSTHTYINPIVAVLLGVSFAGETVTSTQLTGLVVILLSVVLVNWESYNLGSLFRKHRTVGEVRAKARVRSKIRETMPFAANETAGDPIRGAEYD